MLRKVSSLGFGEQSSAGRGSGSPGGCLHKRVVSTEDRFRKELPLPTGSVSERSISSQSCCAERSFECRWPNVDGWRSGWVERVGRKL